MLYVKTVVRPSPIHGLGLFAVEGIPEGYVIQARHPLFDVLLAPAAVKTLPDVPRAFVETYAWRETPGGVYHVSLDDSRYTNHSLEPNMAYDVVSGHSYALRDIEAGEELTEDYRVYDAEFGDGFCGEK